MAFDPDKALAEIEQRNRLRKSASLPLLNVGAELARLEAAHRERAFERYLDANSELLNRVLRRGVYRKLGRSDALVGFCMGLGIGSCARTIFMKRFQGERLDGT
jgi:hypothetical protein